MIYFKQEQKSQQQLQHNNNPTTPQQPPQRHKNHNNNPTTPQQPPQRHKNDNNNPTKMTKASSTHPKLKSTAIATAKKAGALILRKSKSKKSLNITLKAKKDLVTNADLASEKLIKREIKKAFPDHAIVAEESFQNNGKELEKILEAPYIWFIDPLDGTVNYSYGLKQYAVSIGIFKTAATQSSKNFEYLNGELVLGIVYAPALDELYIAEKEKGTKLNGKKIHVTKTNKVSNAFMSTGFPRNELDNLPYFNQMLKECRAMRRFGAASLDLAYVARGIYDGYWEFGLSPWDIAAGALLIKEAGGRVTDTNGEQLDLFGRDIFGSNGKIHNECVKIFKKI